jgi:hypothetical protein
MEFRMKTVKAAILAAAVFASGAVLAQDAPKPHALVHADAGSVSVGNTAVTVDSSAGANAGDTIVVAQGQATVTYDNGCSVTVSGSYVIEKQAPNCRGGTAALDSDGKYVAAGVLGALVLVGAVAGSGGGDSNAQPSSP